MYMEICGFTNLEPTNMTLHALTYLNNVNEREAHVSSRARIVNMKLERISTICHLFIDAICLKKIF